MANDWPKDTAGSDVYSLGFGKTAKRLLVGRSAGLTTFGEVPQLEARSHISRVSALRLAVSKDGDRFAVVGDDKVAFHSLKQGKRLGEMNCRPLAAAFTDDGALLVATRGAQLVHQIKIFDSQTGKPARHITTALDKINGIAFSADRLAVSDDKQVEVWNLADRTRNAVFAGTGPLAFSPDGRYLACAAASKSGAAVLWNVSGKHVELEFVGKSKRARQIIFAPDGSRLATSDSDVVYRRNSNSGDITIWEPVTGLEMLILANAGPLLGFSPDGKTLFTASGRHINPNQERGSVADVETPNLFGTHVVQPPLKRSVRRRASSLVPKILTAAKDVRAIAFSPDGRLLASGGNEEAVTLWDVKTGEKRQTIGESSDRRFRRRRTESLGFLPPDGEVLAVGGSGGATQLLNIQNGELQELKTRYLFDVDLMAVSTDGRMLATCASRGDVNVWDVSRGELIRTLDVQSLKSLSFSRGNSTLATGDASGNLQIWNPQSGEATAKTTLADDVILVSFSPDDRKVLAASRNGVEIWELETGRRRTMFECGYASPLAASPDGRWLAGISGGEFKLWNLETGGYWDKKTESRSYSMRLLFDPSSRILAMAAGSQIMLFNLETLDHETTH